MISQTAEQNYFIELIGAVLFEKELAPPPQQMDYQKMCRLAAHSSLSGFLYDGFRRAAFDVPADTLAMSLEMRNRSVAREAIQEVEAQQILSSLERSGVRCVPLKGLLLKELYPKPYLRLSVDVDILCDARQFGQVEQVMSPLGYTLQHRGGCHDVYVKAPNLNVEIHNKLFHTPASWREFSKQAWKRAVPYQEYQAVRQFTLEDSYLYLMLHTSKHLRAAGAGLRSVLDQMLFLLRYADMLNWEEVNAQLERYGLGKVHRHFLELGPHLFPECREISPFFASLSEECSPEMLDTLSSFLFRSGAMGTVQTLVSLNLMRSEQQGVSLSSRLRYALHRLFPDRQAMEKIFPKLERAPGLLPFYWVERLVKTALFRSNYVNAEVQSMKHLDEQEISQLKQLYRALGL